MAGKYSRIDVIRSQVDRLLEGVYTMIPAIVKTYNSTTQTASTQLAISQNIVNDSEFVAASVMDEVPIMFPFGDTFRMGWNLKKGDNVMVLFSMRSLEEWEGSDGSKPVVPFSQRRHSNSDAIALAGLLPSVTRDEKYKDNPHIADKETYIVFNNGSDGLFIGTDKDVTITAAGNVNVNCVTANINASSNIELNSPTTHCTGQLKVDGAISAGGLISSAVDVAAPMAYSVTYGMGIMSQGSILATTKSLKDHTHNYSGTTTSGAPNSEHAYSGVTTIPDP